MPKGWVALEVPVLLFSDKSFKRTRFGLFPSIGAVSLSE